MRSWRDYRRGEVEVGWGGGNRKRKDDTKECRRRNRKNKD